MKFRAAHVRAMTSSAPTEFRLHRRRRRDEQFGEKIEKAAPPSEKQLLNLRLHRSHRDAR